MSPKVENGGFPDPPPSEPVHVVHCSHLACGAETEILLPASVPAGAVRRVVCAGCATRYETASVDEIDTRGWLDRPPSRRWPLIAIPIAVIVVFEVLVLIGSIGSDERPPPDAGSAGSRASVVREPGFSLALPSGWRREAQRGDESFRARSADGGGEATLFVDRDPSLTLSEFERRSLARLRRAAGQARVQDRVAGATPERSVIHLRARAPSGTAYQVSLRESGPYRYYLSTALRPEAPRDALAGAKLIQSSFTPEASTATVTTPQAH